MNEELKLMMDPSENILYEGKPDGKGLLLKGIFNENLPAFLYFGVIDLVLVIVSSKVSFIALVIVLVFIFSHGRKFSTYLSEVVHSIKELKNSAYIVTDKAVYLSNGKGDGSYESKRFEDCVLVDMNRSQLDCFCNTGDVVILTGKGSDAAGEDVLRLESIQEFHWVYRTVKELIEKTKNWNIDGDHESASSECRKESLCSDFDDESL